MRKIFYVLAFLLLGTVGELSAQMILFKGSFEDAVKKANEEKKDLFVDFYADWCEPCKMMAAQVFTLPEVGTYFNAHFICVQVDVEAKENGEIAKKYGVNVLPTMVFVNRDGKELRRITGVVSPSAFIREAKIVTGEALSFEQMYEKYKKKKKDVEIMQQLLLEAPGFIMTQQGYDRQKWGTRVESLFPEYLKMKKLEDMINESDFAILTLYHPQTTKQDPIFDFVATNFNKFAGVVKQEEVAGYLVAMNNSYIIQLCKKGDLLYKERLGRVSTDLKEAYSGITFGSLSVQEAITLLADATYSLYRHDENSFFATMDKYFAGKGEQTDLNDYTQPLEDLFIVYQGKLSENAYAKCIPWIAKALEKEMDAELRTRLLVMIGQCFQNTGNNDRAKQSFNQAYLVSAQIENVNVMKQLQQVIQQSLQGL